MKTTLSLDNCPNCGGTLSLEEQTGKIVCKYCGCFFNYEELKEDVKYNTESENEYNEYSCNFCGGVIVTDINSITSICPYCGKGSVMKNRITGRYCPDYIIPFFITPTRAKENFNEVLYRKMTTKKFKNNFKIEDVTSLFVPFWLYNTDVLAEITYEYTTRDKKGRAKIKRKKVRFSESYDKLPVDASVKMDDSKMDRLEPYDYSQLKKFDKVYFIGHKAEKYDTDVKIMSGRAEKRIEKTAKTVFSRYLYEHSKSQGNILINAVGNVVSGTTSEFVKGTMRAMGKEDLLSDVNFDNEFFEKEYLADSMYVDRIKKSTVKADFSDYRYALFPVYIIRGSYRGKNYFYYVNGQTGKVAANFPLDYLQYYLNQLLGAFVGSFFIFGVFIFLAKFFIKFWTENKDIQPYATGISNGMLFLSVWLVSFLFVYFLEAKYNGKEDLNRARENVGEVSVVQNAKNFRVPGTFKILP
jgi:hypothetical protein